MTLTATPVEAAPDAASRAWRAFWLFLGSFLSFIAVIVVSLVLSNPDYQEALYARAQELGVNQNYLPADVLAQIVREHPEPAWTYWVNAVLFALSAVLAATGLRLMGGIAGARGVLPTKAAVALAVVGGLAMATMAFLPRPLADGNGWLADNWWIYMTLVGVFVVGTSLALILVAVALRETGLARRTGVVTIALCALTIVAQLTVSAPPIVPMMLGTIYAFNLARAAKKAA